MNCETSKSANNNCKVWISFIGLSPTATINCIWAAIKRDNFVPDKVVLLASSAAKEQFEGYIQILQELLSYYNEKLNPDNFLKFVSISDMPVFHSLVSSMKRAIKKYAKRAEVAVDITPGLKIMSVAAFTAALSKKVNRIYYLYLIDEKVYSNKLYPEIPCRHQILYKFIGEEIAKGKFVEALGCDKDVYSKY